MRRPPLLFAAGLLVLCLLPATAAAAPPTCDPPQPQPAVEGHENWMYVADGCRDPDNDPLSFAVAEDAGSGHVETDAFPGSFIYVPDAGFVGDDSFTFTASDGTSTTLPVTVAVVVAANQPPVCGTLTAEVEPDVETPLPVFGPGGECSDPEFDPLDFTIVDAPAHGTATVQDESWNAFVYRPEAGYVGPDSFTFRADDGLDESDLVTFEITVLPPNRAPHCESIALRVDRNGVLPLDALRTCSDPDGDAFFPSFADGGAPLHGDVTFDPRLAYVPRPGYVGPDRIRYRVIDSRGGASNEATVNITVVGPAPPKPPQPVPDRTAPDVSTTITDGQRLASVRKRGLKLTLRSSERGTAGLELVADRAVARRLGLARRPRRPVVLGSLQRPVAAGTTALTVALKPKARRALRTVRSVRLRLKCVVTDLAGNRRSLSVRFQLGR